MLSTGALSPREAEPLLRRLLAIDPANLAAHCQLIGSAADVRSLLP